VTFVRSHIELILVGIVVVSVVPIAIELLRSRRRSPRTFDSVTTNSGRD